ncbi:MAG: 3-methyl-2-oxobutanoate hydroxymethyltransferase [Endomicrobiales bacterium]|nr:3-methyl-2-oxobutanoate hydroxymethyltransferase [Endomicrobiales bacterium]
MEKITTTRLIEMKQRGEKITALTAYDCPTARLLNEAGIDVVLVGDSVGMVKLGYESTLSVNMEDMLYHARSVKKGNSRAFLAVDMPFLSYESKPSDAVYNAGLLVKIGGAEAVKLEGGREMLKSIRAVIEAKIPVIGHLGLTPQGIHKFGGYKVQGRDPKSAQKMIDDALALEESGVFMLVLECIPAGLAKKITSLLSIPTIGIGAGPHCDGQVLVTDDLLGLSGMSPKFVKKYANLQGDISKAVKKYRKEVRASRFPSRSNSY